MSACESVIFPMADPIASTEIPQAIIAFTNKLYNILTKNPGNVFFSPLSLHIILSMAYQGSRNKTSKIMGETLQIPDAKSVAVGYKWMIEHLKNLDRATLYLANKIYVGKISQCLEEFENVVQNYFSSEVEVVDFCDKHDAVRKINEWVARKTENTIGNIVNEALIEEDTALFLLNAMYFKAEWNEPFTGELVSEEFYLDNENTVNVQMMKGWKNGCYKNDHNFNAQIFGLPYKNTNIKLLIVLPNEKNGIKDLEAKLSTFFNLNEMFNGLKSAKVKLSLPKFKFETTADFSEELKQIGLGPIFDKKQADFKGMLVEDGGSLCVDKILQKAVIEVNEKGTEAGVVSAMLIKRKYCAWTQEEEEIIIFTVDHPAIFMLIEETNELTNVLFIGRLSYPK